MPYEHLRLEREPDTNERHRKADKRPRFKPDDPRQFGAELQRRFEQSKARLTEDIGGYDDRRLLKIRLHEGETLPELGTIAGIEIVSQEDKAIVLAFATDGGMDEVERRLATLARDGKVTRKELLFVIEDFDHWTPEERMGSALREQGFPDAETFILDVELWPQERVDRRGAMLEAFRADLRQHGIPLLDTLQQPSLVLVRIRCDREQAEGLLLRHRDARTVDLPPRLGVEIGALLADIQDIPPPPPPPGGAPPLAILDAGVTAGHPLLASAMGDAQGFVHPHRDVADPVPDGHGTFVAGVGLYGDIGAALRDGRFVPQLRIFSGKVFKNDDSDQTELVERSVEEAVRYFQNEYGCRVFNLSYGDLNKVYDGRHLRGLAYTLDRLSRELGVLFVTATGNRPPYDLPNDLHGAYPDYLFQPESRVVDPGTALNALTVGGLAHHTATQAARRHPDALEDAPVARRDQPSPFTRCGPSINGAIKPDLVEHAGNLAIDRGGRPRTSGLGVVSLNSGFAAGRLFSEDGGTSYAAPLVAHRAARLLADLPAASPSLLRTLLGAHALWPEASRELLDPDDNAEGREKLLQAIGYGRVDEAALYRSLDHTVTLIAEATIENDRHHFYEIPVPEAFWLGRRRRRHVTVALAYAPEVRTTRLEYRATKLSFSLVNAAGLDDVSLAFRRNRDQGMPERGTNRWIAGDKRNSGTLQVSRWRFGTAIRPNRLFVVVTRQDGFWSTVKDQPEDYALCAVLDDRENAEAQLYNQVRQALQQRARIRLQV